MNTIKLNKHEGIIREFTVIYKYINNTLNKYHNKILMFIIIRNNY